MKIIKFNLLKGFILGKIKNRDIRKKIKNHIQSHLHKNYDGQFFINDSMNIFCSALVMNRLKKEVTKMITFRLNLQNLDTYLVEFNDTFKPLTPELLTSIEAEEKKVAEELHLKNMKLHSDNLSSLIQMIDGGAILGIFDLEFWEMDKNKITEIGWVIKDFKTNKVASKHIIVEEFLNYRNGRYVRDNKFSRTDSKTLPLQEALKSLKHDFFDKIEILLGHGLESDIITLKNNNFDIHMVQHDLSLYGNILVNKSFKNRISLEKLLRFLEIEFNEKSLHNAATDSEYILRAFEQLAKETKKETMQQ